MILFILLHFLFSIIEDINLYSSSISIFHENKNVLNSVAYKNICFNKKIGDVSEDIDLIIPIINGINIISDANLEYDTSEVNIKSLFKNNIIDIPKTYRTKLFKKTHFKGSIQNEFTYHGRTYIPIVLTAPYEKIYFICEFESNGSFKHFYYKELIY